MKEKIVKIVEGLQTVPLKSWVLLISLILILVNIVLSAFGVNPIIVSEDNLYMIISGALAILAPLYAMWKNWNGTKEAQTSQEVLDLMKQGLATADQVQEYIENVKKIADSSKEAARS